MRHRVKTVKLGRQSAHRNALLASLVCHLIERKRIQTTLPKARAARSLAEKMVTLGKRAQGDESKALACRRRAISKLGRKECVSELFDTLAPSFTERAGGYTRIVKLGRRSSDSSEMVILEWVESGAKAKKPGPAAEPKAKKKAAAPKAEKAKKAKPPADTKAAEAKPKRKPRKKKSDEADAS